MINKEIREDLSSIAPEGVIFDNPSFDNSIVGVSYDGAIIYDYEKMVEEFMLENECTSEEAEDFIDYNTIRSLPYTASCGVPPVILYKIS